jgi:hypothetical protein
MATNFFGCLYLLFWGIFRLIEACCKEFDWWLAMPAAKSVGFPPQKAGAHRATCISLPDIPQIPAVSGPGSFL